MFLPHYRYTPVVTEMLAEIERLRARIGRLVPDPAVLETARRRATARRAAGAATLDSMPLSTPAALTLIEGGPVDLPADTEQAVQGYVFALGQIAGDWPADRDLAALPVLAGLHFYLVHNPGRQGPPTGLRRTPAVLRDFRTGMPLMDAPPAETVRPLLGDLVGWLHTARSAVRHEIRAAVAYRQLVLIQPQQEANGRTACAYAALLLHRADLLPHGLPGIEAAFAAAPDRYHAALDPHDPSTADAPIDFTGWLEFFLTTLREELRGAHAGLQAGSAQGSSPPVVRLNPRQRRILELLRVRGASLANQECQQMFGVSPVTAARDFRELVDLGLVQMQGQGRATYYIHAPDAD